MSEQKDPAQSINSYFLKQKQNNNFFNVKVMKRQKNA